MTDRESKFVRVATEHVSALFGQAIERNGYSAGVIAEGCGGVESGWRNKLAGRRLFRLQDVLSLAATYDLNLLNLLFPAGDGTGAHAIRTVRDLVPSAYAGLIEQQPRKLPVLRDPMHRWTTLRSQLEGWVAAEVAAGRGPQLTEDVVVHQVLKKLDDLGLRSTTATITRSPGAARLAWNMSSSVVDLYFTDDHAPAQRDPTSSPRRLGDAYTVMTWRTGTEGTEPRLIACQTVGTG